jgi:hypothetical protein
MALNYVHDADKLSSKSTRSQDEKRRKEHDMKTGRTVQEVATEIMRQSEAKRDFLAPTSQMKLAVGRMGDSERFGVLLRLPKQETPFALSPHTHGQIAARVQIPMTYYNRLLDEAPELLRDNVEHWWRANDEPRMVRTLDGRARAFLSNRYRRIDNLQVAQIILPMLAEMDSDVKVESSEVTESKMYLKCVYPAVQDTVTLIKPGTHERIREVVQAGFVFSNSEIGLGNIQCQPFNKVLSCTNGMIVEEFTMRKAHLGRRVTEDDFSEEGTQLWSDDTRRADDHALMLKIRDTVLAMGDQKRFSQIVEKMNAATERTLGNKPQESIEELANFGLSESERGLVFKHLVEGGTLSQWGLVNAVTRSAQDAESYDRATELESLGGKLLALDSGQWAAAFERN